MNILCVCIFAIHISSLAKCLFKPLVCFLPSLLLLSLELSLLFWKQVLYQIYDLQDFLQICDLCFHSVNSAFQKIEVLHFDKAQIIYSSPMDDAFGVISKKSKPSTSSERFSSVFSFQF